MAGAAIRAYSPALLPGDELCDDIGAIGELARLSTGDTLLSETSTTLLASWTSSEP